MSDDGDRQVSASANGAFSRGKSRIRFFYNRNSRCKTVTQTPCIMCQGGGTSVKALGKLCVDMLQ
jgi:hypothetical protein